MVRLTEPALTPGRSGYWCDLVLAPGSAFLSSLLLSPFPFTLIQHSQPYYLRIAPFHSVFWKLFVKTWYARIMHFSHENEEPVLMVLL